MACRPRPFWNHNRRPNLTDESIDYFVGDTLNTSLEWLVEQARRGLLFSSTPDETGDASIERKARQITRGQFATQGATILG